VTKNGFLARMKKIEWPKTAVGYVGYNAGFEPGSNSAMMLYGESLDPNVEV
jgi:hypothetical protein